MERHKESNTFIMSNELHPPQWARDWYRESPSSSEIEEFISGLRKCDETHFSIQPRELGLNYPIRYAQIAAMLEWLLHERHDG